jgi:hypothetical protein
MAGRNAEAVHRAEERRPDGAASDAIPARPIGPA